MVVAIPVNKDGTIFHNAGYAPFFALYNTSGKTKTHIKTVENPRAKQVPVECSTTADCSCPEEMLQTPQHVLTHYYLVEILHECDVVLVKFLCEHTRRIFDYVGIKTYKIPPIIHDERHAINNFILGSNNYETHL